MKPIKKIAGDILLLLYALQRKRGSLDAEIISFDRDMNSKAELEKSELGKKLLKVAAESITDVYNAMRYLEEGCFISFKESNDNMTYYFFNLRVTKSGIDIVEGIERGEKERKEFHITFNIKLADNVNLESLIKNEVGSFIKGLLI
ncbi:hypothetical protein J7K92_00375 [bacterium]|nr:hypothetical protein [bacterium]